MTLLELLQGVRSILVADLAVQGQVTDRVHMEYMPQGSETPAIVMSLVSAPRPQQLSDRSGLTEARIQVIAYSRANYSEAMTLAQNIDTALTPTAVVNGEIVTIERDNMSSLGTIDGERKERAIATDFMITFNEG